MLHFYFVKKRVFRKAKRRQTFFKFIFRLRSRQQKVCLHLKIFASFRLNLLINLISHRVEACDCSAREWSHLVNKYDASFDGSKHHNIINLIRLIRLKIFVKHLITLNIPGIWEFNEEANLLGNESISNSQDD